MEVGIVKQTDAQLRATKKYQSKFEMLRVRVTPEEKQRIVEHTNSRKESLSTFLRRAIFKTIADETENKG